MNEPNIITKIFQFQAQIKSSKERGKKVAFEYQSLFSSFFFCPVLRMLLESNLFHHLRHKLLSTIALSPIYSENSRSEVKKWQSVYECRREAKKSVSSQIIYFRDIAVAFIKAKGRQRIFCFEI